MSNSHDFTYHRLILSVIMAALALSAFPAFCADAKGNPQDRKILMTPQRIENELKEICSAKYDSPKKNEAADRLRNFKISES